MAKPVKLIKVLKHPTLLDPSVRIKTEFIEEEEDMGIPCRLCSKEFCNELALRNHLRMEHSGVEVDLQEWVATAIQTKMKEDPDGSAAVDKKRTQLVSSMAPSDMMALASQDVSYIIINADQGTKESKVSRKKKSEEDAGAKQKIARRERDKEITPITGPFECLQPSTLVAEGTCHQIFFSCCDYSMHFRDEHTRRRKAIKCQVCEKLLASAVGDDTPFPCQVCGMGFHCNKQLAAHTSLAHVKLKPFECGVCHKRFTQQGGVQQHMRMHTGDRPFPCTYCGKSFTQKSGLDQHLRTHTKIKPYRCVICGKTFVQSVHLKQHMRTHTNVSPFQCAICEKRFKQSSHLNYHLKNHNEANMTDDQKRKYQELIGMIDEHNRAARGGAAEEEGEGDGGEGAGELEHTEMLETVIIEEAEGSSMDGAEQIVLQDDREYILADTGDETWSVRLGN